MSDLTKSIKLSMSTWKSLQKAKLDKGAVSADEVIKEYLENDGYKEDK